MGDGDQNHLKETPTLVLILTLLASTALISQSAVSSIMVHANTDGAPQPTQATVSTNKSGYRLGETFTIYEYAATSNSTITVTPQPVSIPGCSDAKDLGDLSNATYGSQWLEIGRVGWPNAATTICVAFSIGPSVSALKVGYVDLVLAGNSPWGLNEGGGWIRVDIYDRDSGAWSGGSGFAGWATPLWNKALYVHNVPFPSELIMKVTAISSWNLDLVMRLEFAGTAPDSISGTLADRVFKTPIGTSVTPFLSALPTLRSGNECWFP
jgi:hypothetical protein